MSKLEENLKVGIYFLSVVLPVIDGIVGAVRAIRDCVLRMQGKKTSVVLAVEDHVRKQVESVIKEMDLKMREQINKNESMVEEQIRKGII